MIYPVGRNIRAIFSQKITAAKIFVGRLDTFVFITDEPKSQTCLVSETKSWRRSRVDSFWVFVVSLIHEKKIKSDRFYTKEKKNLENKKYDQVNEL